MRWLVGVLALVRKNGRQILKLQPLIAALVLVAVAAGALPSTRNVTMELLQEERLPS